MILRIWTDEGSGRGTFSGHRLGKEEIEVKRFTVRKGDSIYSLNEKVKWTDLNGKQSRELYQYYV